MDLNSEEYHQQLQFINQMLERTPAEGPERDELYSLKQNIEELLSLTGPLLGDINPGEGSSADTHYNQKDSNNTLDNEYALFMSEINNDEANANEEKSVLSPSTSVVGENFKELEGKKFRAPHKHQWGQISYHNCMVCSVPEDAEDIDDFQVKVLFLNPTHKEMLPCPYYFNFEKNCNYSEEQCKFSHGEWVPYSSLQEYIKPKFELLTIGNEVLAKQDDELWYRAKIAQILKGKCLVRFEVEKKYEEIVFENILPLEKTENDSDYDDSGSDNDVQVVDTNEDGESLRMKLRHEELINRSLMMAPDRKPLGDWEKYTRGIGSKLMQKMGYIVGTGLGKQGLGIIKPVEALILPQGKSLDFCMNLKEQSRDPNLFHLENQPKSRLYQDKRPSRKASKKAEKKIKLEQMELDKFISWYFGRGMMAIQETESDLLRQKLKVAETKAVNVAKFIIDERFTKITEKTVKLKASIKKLEEKHLEPKKLYKNLSYRETDLKRLNIFGLLIQGELGRRKNNKEMSVF